jgi:hypothetical protein
VFGEVADESSMELVRKIEGYGSRSGRTSATVTIADSGTL